MILQLSGKKTIRLLPPSSVWSIKPDPGAKHWPAASQAEIDTAYRETGIEVILNPGDQLYVPVLWFHSVSADGWSATANRYYFKPKAWIGYIEEKKPALWQKFEDDYGRVC